MASNSAPDAEAARIASLRSTAQEHLREIDLDQTIEQEKDTRRLSELEREAHRREAARISNRASIANAKEKACRMRTAQDVLNRLRWDEDVHISQYIVGYLDRFGGCFELPAEQWSRDSTEEEWIPQHRIRYFKRIVNGEEEVVWHRDKRVDKVFGSSVAQQQRTVESSNME